MYVVCTLHNCRCVFLSKLLFIWELLTGTAGAEKERTRGEEKERGREVTEEGNGEKEKDRGAPKVCHNCIHPN